MKSVENNKSKVLRFISTIILRGKDKNKIFNFVVHSICLNGLRLSTSKTSQESTKN